MATPCAYGLAAALAVALTRATGGVALLWPANALAAAVLIRLPHVRWLSAAVSLLGAGIAANGIGGHVPWPMASLFACVNMLEIALMVAAFRAVIRFPYPDITIAQAGIMTAVFGILIPGLAAAMGGLAMRAGLGTPWWPSLLQWWSSDALGAWGLHHPVQPEGGPSAWSAANEACKIC